MVETPALSCNDFPANPLPEFVAYVQANQAKPQWARRAPAITHIACLLLNYRMGTSVTHVPYRGAGPALQDLIAGRIDFMCEVISTGLPPIQGKLVKPVALLSTRRASVLPQLPTALEQGLADVDADGWNAFFFPKGTPEPIIRRLNAATSRALNNPALSVRMEELGRPCHRSNGAPLRTSASWCARRSRNGRPRSRRAASARTEQQLVRCGVATG